MSATNDSFSYEFEEDREYIDKVLQMFDNHCKDMTNILKERYLFLKRRQLLDETIE